MKINVRVRSANGRSGSGLRLHFEKHLMFLRLERRQHASCGCFLFFVFICAIVGTASSQDLAGLQSALSNGNKEEKRTALMQLRSLRSEAASRLAVASLTDKDPMVRATAASAILFLPPTEAVAALSPLISDKDEFVRREAVFALGETADPSAASVLRSALVKDKSQEVRTAAAVAIGKTGDPASVDALVDLLGAKPTEENEMFRRAATRSIGQIALVIRGGTSQVLTPQNFLSEKFKDIGKAPSASLLTHFAEAEKTLVHILESSQEADDTRREAAFSLGAIGDPTSRIILTKYVSSRDPYMVEIAKEALLRLGPPQ
jgi:HEAT repeat protein